jgi:hypothetical protein
VVVAERLFVHRKLLSQRIAIDAALGRVAAPGGQALAILGILALLVPALGTTIIIGRGAASDRIGAREVERTTAPVPDDAIMSRATGGALRL